MANMTQLNEGGPSFTREELRAFIWGLRKAGLSWNQVAQHTGKSRRSVQKICSTVQKNQSFKNHTRSGRPSRLSDRDRRKIVELLRKAKVKTAEAIRKEASTYYNINVSTSTIRRVFKKCGYVARLKRKKLVLTKEEKKKRLRWAQDHKTWTVDNWKDVIWADETAFTLVWEGKEHTWTKEDRKDILVDDLVTPTMKFGGRKLLVWCCITYAGVGYACKINDILDAELYSKILRGELMDTLSYYHMDSSTVIFLHDNDPKHTSQTTQDMLDHLGISTMMFPSYSPDLNPIENYWKHLKSKLRSKRQIYADIDELWEAVEEEVAKVNKDLCQNLIASMPERVQAVINAKGGYTHY